MYRMGQTNQLARYPLHFHLVGTSMGPTQTLISDCSVHHSFFRCYAIHGTNNVTITQNTAYDAIAHCYFLEDGVEENNTFAYNFGAHIHPLGRFMEVSQGVGGNGQSWWSQYAAYYTDNPNLIHTSDMAAGVFYITNAYNTFIGNAASGGWTGFSFPNLPKPIKMHANVTGIIPMNRPLIRFQGNSAHSTGYWWSSAAGVYIGGNLNEETNPGYLTYTHGREVSRDTCLYYTSGSCPKGWQTSLVLRDTKVFLANRGIQDWGDREDIIRFEGHDLGLSANVFGSVWIDQMLLNCRSNNTVTMWNGCNWHNSWTPWGYCNIRDYAFFNGAVGFQFYDTGMRHIISNSIFRNCAVSQFKQCNECFFASFELLTHSDQFLPDHMQSTTNITFQNCDMEHLWHFTVDAPTWDSISGRLQNWLDVDGSAYHNGRSGRTLLGSNRSNEWYQVNDECYGVLDEMYVCPLNELDSVVSMTFNYDPNTESTIGHGFCGNGDKSTCPVIGRVTHFGRPKGSGLKIGGNPKVTGPMIYEAGGWFVEFSSGTPADLKISHLQIEPLVSALVALPYPSGTTFTSISAVAASWCSWSWGVCSFDLTATTSVEAVRNGGGDLYYWDSAAGILYFKLLQPPDEGNFKSLGSHPFNQTYYPLSNFTRSGITLIYQTWDMHYQVIANCPGKSGLYCPFVDRSVPAALGCGTCGPSGNTNPPGGSPPGGHNPPGSIASHSHFHPFLLILLFWFKNSI
uniref:CEMIP beta-helix domain-containing protein n=1 Tax=Arcella intermedia TaxID=1963864 RepID=A0A6B2KYW6_9EUKA